MLATGGGLSIDGSLKSIGDPVNDDRWIGRAMAGQSDPLCPRVGGSVVCTLRGRSSARKLGPES